MTLLGLIGYPLGHSWSPEWYQRKFIQVGLPHAEYRLFPLSGIGQFPQLLKDMHELSGLNVTIPHKVNIIPYLDELDEQAAAVGAVNTIRITRHGGKIYTKGYNTDVAGFLHSLPDRLPPGPVLILGTGGAAKAISYALSLKKIPFRFVSRQPSEGTMLSYRELSAEIIKQHRLIVNATPLGMYPETDQYPPIPYNYLSAENFLYDLIYNPPETSFLRKGKEMGAATMNGVQMLENQAELSFRIFTRQDE